MDTATAFDYSALPEAVGQRVSTHWNLQKLIYSIKAGSAPVFYAPSARLTRCSFVIDKRLREKFESRMTCRTVHALIKGNLIGYDATAVNGEIVRCNPFRYSTFVRASDEVAVYHASEIVLHPDKTIEAIGLVFVS